MAKVKVDAGGRWVFTGWLCREGYGRIWPGPGGAVITAHVASYLCHVGKGPEGMHLDHLCRNRACCNPNHLEVVPPRTNILRGTGFSAVNAAKIECINGHPLSGDNLHVLPGGRRRCRTCSSATSRRYWARKQATS